MGQKDSEEAAEFVATVRQEHVAMKAWYNDPANAAQLKSKYGPTYPGLWKEVLNWSGWKETRKLYLQQQQQQQGGGSATAVKTEDCGGAEAAPRKRKSRWGNSSSSSDKTATTTETNDSASAQAAKRRSRWGNGAPPPPPPPPSMPQTIPGLGAALPGMVQPSQLSAAQQAQMKQLQAQLRHVNDRIANLETEAARVDALPREHPERSPSPPPIYGADGKRKNTRAVRWKERYTNERQDLLEKIMKINSPSVSNTLLRNNALFQRKRTKKIRIPIEEYPTYNFIGLIIGPRGKTQKELEAKTGCKIAIRGRGSVKEGARGRRDGKVMEGDNEALHVVITGDDQRAVDAASDMIEQMLVVIDDEKNVHKQQQLKELALLNGTLKDDDYFCPICAERGHRSFECPKRFAQHNKPAGVQVKCAICGDSGHPTGDCPRKNMPPQPAGVVGGLEQKQNQQEMDSDYLSFMAELDGKKAAAAGGDNKPQPTATTTTSSAAVVPPPTTTLPPPPPPPPPGGLPPPPPHPPTTTLPPPPPPPAGLPPPLPSQGGNYYGGNAPPPQQEQGGWNGGGYGGQQQQQQPPYQQQQQPPPPPQQPQQQQQQVKPGDETSGWDPSAYYGQQQQGAGGFNWWEQ